MKTSYWLCNAAQEHVDIVKNKGYHQLNMGPKEPLEKMHAGDWILYYSPTILFEKPETTCHTFSGISCLTDNHVYPQDPNNPIRWRRNAQYYHCKPHHVQEFHHHVEFLHKYDNWLDALKETIFKISPQDFLTVAQTILVPDTDKCLLF